MWVCKTVFLELTYWDSAKRAEFSFLRESTWAIRSRSIRMVSVNAEDFPLIWVAVSVTKRNKHYILIVCVLHIKQTINHDTRIETTPRTFVRSINRSFIRSRFSFSLSALWIFLWTFEPSSLLRYRRKKNVKTNKHISNLAKMV